MSKINEQSIRSACEALAELLIKKNHDYGGSVEEQYIDYGDTSLLIRCEDKLRRLKNLQKTESKVKEESKAETYTDLAGYAILASILKID